MKIQQLYGYRIPSATLRRFYLRNELKYTTAKAELYPHNYDLDALQQERIDYAMKLSDFIFDKATEVIYFDETSFHSRLVQKRAWWVRGMKFKIPSTKERGKGFTLFGAISNCLEGNGYFEVHRTTNSLNFIEFMTNIQSEIKPAYRNKRLILVADNHGAHKGPSKMAVLEQFCEVHFIPTYSCELNGPIETCWSVIKKRVIPKFTKLQLKMTSSRQA